MTSESESAFIGNLIRELRNAQRALKCLQYIDADMCKLEGKVRKVQKKHWKRLAQPESNGIEHAHLSDQEAMSLYIKTELWSCIGNLTREVRNAQIALTHLEHISNNIYKLEEKARKA